MSLAAQLAASHCMKSLIFVCLRYFIENRNLSIDLSYAKQRFDLCIVAGSSVYVFQDWEVEICLLDNIKCKSDNWRSDLFIADLIISRLLWNIVYVRNAINVDCDAVHIHDLEVADSASKSTLKNECILCILHSLGNFCLHNLQQFIFTQEDRIIIVSLHDNLSALLTKLPER